MKKILLLAPRLDLPFGDSNSNPTPDPKLANDHCRRYWRIFIDNVIKEYSNRNDVDFEVIEMQLAKFTPQLVYSKNVDMVLVPHKEYHNFPIDNIEVYYYMQTAFPMLFSVDKKGWAGGISTYPFDSMLKTDYTDAAFNMFRDRALDNQSKYPQREYRDDLNLPKDYVLFACQIPTDQTIKYHSNIGVEQALEYTCSAAEQLNLPIVIKGHPARPETQLGFKIFPKKFKNAIFLITPSIHQLIKDSRCVVVVNSGVGAESLLHKKPVVTFGRADYDCVTNHATPENIKDILNNPIFDEQRVINFYDSWYNWAYDTSNFESFKKLP